MGPNSLPLPKLKTWSGCVRQGPGCSGVGRRTWNAAPNALTALSPRPQTTPARVAADTAGEHTWPCARSRPASRTRRLWNLRESFATAQPASNTAYRARLLLASPGPAPAISSLSNTQLSRSNRQFEKSNTSTSQPWNSTECTLTQFVPPAQSQLGTAAFRTVITITQPRKSAGSKPEVDRVGCFRAL